MRAFDSAQSSVSLFVQPCPLLMWSNAATELEMKDRVRRGVFCAGTSALMLLWLGGVGAAQRPQLLKNLDLCNGADRTSPDLQIDGCTGLINSGAQTPQSLVIAYNNRGNAYSAKGEYDAPSKITISR